MAATIGNEWWKLRSKHGRDKLFETPDLLWGAAVEYFEATDLRKWIVKDWVGKDAMEVEREKQTPYTWSGLCLYLGCDESFFRQQKQLKNQDLNTVMDAIGRIIYTQKFEGASVGAFNANIISRDLGLADVQKMTINKVGKDLADEEYVE